MLSTQAYFRQPGVSSHAWIELQRRPFHCWAQYVDPNRQDAEPTPALRLGTLVHTLVLMPETFGEEFVLTDALHRRTNAGQAVYAALAATGKQGSRARRTPPRFRSSR